MKVAMLKALGQPLTIEAIPEPVPGAGEVLVRVLATPVLVYIQDVFSGERKYPMMLPLVPGSGAIGVVEQTGPDATRIKPGQLVFCDPTIRSRDDPFSPDVIVARIGGPRRRLNEASCLLSPWVLCREGTRSP